MVNGATIAGGRRPLVEANCVPIPGNYWGVFWLGSSLYIAQGGEFASFDASGNQSSSGWGPLSAQLKAMIAAPGQPAGSAVNFTQRGVNLTVSCGGSPTSIVNGTNFTANSSNTLMLADDPAKSRRADLLGVVRAVRHLLRHRLLAEDAFSDHAPQTIPTDAGSDC